MKFEVEEKRAFFGLVEALKSDRRGSLRRAIDLGSWFEFLRDESADFSMPFVYGDMILFPLTFAIRFSMSEAVFLLIEFGATKISSRRNLVNHQSSMRVFGGRAIYGEGWHATVPQERPIHNFLKKVNWQRRRFFVFIMKRFHCSKPKCDEDQRFWNLPECCIMKIIKCI